jgi:acetyl-CoA carboxylase carboxyltransferase component
MGPRQAVGIIHRRDIAAAPDPDAQAGRLARAYAEEHLNASTATALGAVDEIVPPAETRARLTSALTALTGGT